MEKLLAGGGQYITYLAILAGVLITVTVGVMSLLLPILVFRILSEISEVNKKMTRIITLLNEEARSAQSQRQAEHIRPGPLVSKKEGSLNLGEKSLRFQ